MAGETNLDKLLHSMKPNLLPETYVFCTVENGSLADYVTLSPVSTVMEAEGLTLVLTQAVADEAGLPYEGLFRCVTLMVHSSLEAVGLTAVFATKLGEHNISANVIAGYYHDHIFVQADRADAAVRALGELGGQ